MLCYLLLVIPNISIDQHLGKIGHTNQEILFWILLHSIYPLRESNGTNN